jgi:hypothetical protein
MSARATVFQLARGLKNRQLMKVLGRRVSIIAVLDFRILLKLPLQTQLTPPLSMQDGPEKGALRGYGRH